MTKRIIPSSEPEPEPPPAHLSQRAAALWRQVTKPGASAGRLALIQAALESLDRADEARAILSTEGLVLTTPESGAKHLHPLAKLELESRRQFATLWERLALHWDTWQDGKL